MIGSQFGGTGDRFKESVIGGDPFTSIGCESIDRVFGGSHEDADKSGSYPSHEGVGSSMGREYSRESVGRKDHPG